MTEERWRTKAGLLGEIKLPWSALHAELEDLTEAQMTTMRDAQGWTVKDHLIHLAAWERSVVFLLQRKARHEGLGVDEDLYLNGGEDEINDVIYRQYKDLPLDAALDQLRNVHRELLDILHAMSDSDLQKPYREYLPDELSDRDDSPIIDLIYGNTAYHFTEHLGWIEGLVDTV